MKLLLRQDLKAEGNNKISTGLLRSRTPATLRELEAGLDALDKIQRSVYLSSGYSHQSAEDEDLLGALVATCDSDVVAAYSAYLEAVATPKFRELFDAAASLLDAFEQAKV